MTPTRLSSVLLALVTGFVAAEATNTFVRWPGIACTWDPEFRSQGDLAPWFLRNASYDARLTLYCPLPFLEAYDDAGQVRGVTAATVTASPQVYVFDGSSDYFDGVVWARIVQVDAAANGNWSVCSNVTSSAASTGYVTLSPPYCSSAYPIVTLVVELPKVQNTYWGSSYLYHYRLDNYGT